MAPSLMDPSSAPPQPHLAIVRAWGLPICPHHRGAQCRGAQYRGASTGRQYRGASARYACTTAHSKGASTTVRGLTRICSASDSPWRKSAPSQDLEHKLRHWQGLQERRQPTRLQRQQGGARAESTMTGTLRGPEAKMCMRREALGCAAAATG